eukprot:tig00020961_g16699.t1
MPEGTRKNSKRKEDIVATLKGAAAYVHSALIFKRKLISERLFAVFQDRAQTYKNHLLYLKASMDDLGRWLRKYPEVVEASGINAQVGMLSGLLSVRDALAVELEISGEPQHCERMPEVLRMQQQLEREGRVAPPRGFQPTGLIGELYTEGKRMLRRLMEVIPNPAGFQEAYRASVVDSLPPPDAHEEEELHVDPRDLRFREAVPRWARAIEACVDRVEAAATLAKKLAVAFVMSRQMVPVEAIRLMQEERKKDVERRQRVEEAQRVVEGKLEGDPFAAPLLRLASPATSSAPSEDEEEAPPEQEEAPAEPRAASPEGPPEAEESEEEEEEGAGEGGEEEEERAARAAAVMGELEELLKGGSGKGGSTTQRSRRVRRREKEQPAPAPRRSPPPAPAAKPPPELHDVRLGFGDYSPPKKAGGFGFGTASRFGGPITGPPARSPPGNKSVRRAFPSLSPILAVSGPDLEGPPGDGQPAGDESGGGGLAAPKPAPRRLSLIERQAAAALEAAAARFQERWRMRQPQQGDAEASSGDEESGPRAPFIYEGKRERPARRARPKRQSPGRERAEEMMPWPPFVHGRGDPEGSSSSSSSAGSEEEAPVLEVPRMPAALASAPTVWHSYDSGRRAPASFPPRRPRASIAELEAPAPRARPPRARGPAVAAARRALGPAADQPALRDGPARRPPRAPRRAGPGPPKHMRFLPGRRERREKPAAGPGPGDGALGDEVAMLLALFWNKAAGAGSRPAPPPAPAPGSLWGR